MENDYLQALAQVVLPTEILDYFSITGIAQTATEIHISLDERMNNALSNDAQFESKGFMAAVNVTDFPIRDHKVVLRIRRRRWTDTRTGKSFSIPIDLDIVAKGTRYSKEFGAFLNYKIPCSGVISRPAASTSCRSFFITSAGIHLRSTLTVRTRLRLRTMSIGA